MDDAFTCVSMHVVTHMGFHVFVEARDCHYDFFLSHSYDLLLPQSFLYCSSETASY